MKIEINGVEYTGFQSATATVSIDKLTNSFSFTSGISKNINLDFGVGDECVIYVSGERIITGHIEVIGGSGDKDTSSINIAGRDRTGDIVDSAIGKLDDLKTGTLKNLIELVIAHIGADIDVIDLADVKLDMNQDSNSAEIGDNAFDYIQKIARNSHCILTSDDEGNVVIQRSVGVVIDAHVTNRVNGAENNVLNYTFDFDHTGRFFKYLSAGNRNLLFAGTQTPKAVVDQNGFVTDTRIREGRQFVISTENPGASPAQSDRAKWELNIRKARSRTYGATVSGYRNQTGEVWTPNTIAKIFDDNAKINDSMLINEVSYRMDLDDGRTSELGFVNKNAYTLLSEEPRESKSGGNLENALTAKGFQVDAE